MPTSCQASLAGMLQEKGNLLCQMQISKWEKSGCAGGRKDFASRFTSSKAGHLSLPTPPARRELPGTAPLLGRLRGALCPP